MSTDITGDTSEHRALRRQRNAEEDAMREKTNDAGAMVARLRPIERDESFDRTYIPMPGGFEVQTKGKGSSFRIYDGAADFRFPVPEQPYLFDTLEKLAKATHSEVTRLADALAQRDAEIARLRADAARYRIVRRGQKWSVIDGIGNTLRAEELDAAADAAIAAQPTGPEAV